MNQDFWVDLLQQGMDANPKHGEGESGEGFLTDIKTQAITLGHLASSCGGQLLLDTIGALTW
jgi:hypothetical protein